MGDGEPSRLLPAQGERQQDEEIGEFVTAMKEVITYIASQLSDLEERMDGLSRRISTLDASSELPSRPPSPEGDPPSC